mmetsp:Transcript_34487/g.84824  ORF Transcript_34487/g.84824 Transcript_34487/m.84824 type:complete len:232 (-) Transcript_34487:1398-2093(-)
MQKLFSQPQHSSGHRKLPIDSAQQLMRAIPHSGWRGVRLEHSRDFCNGGRGSGGGAGARELEAHSRSRAVCRHCAGCLRAPPQARRPSAGSLNPLCLRGCKHVCSMSEVNEKPLLVKRPALQFCNRTCIDCDCAAPNSACRKAYSTVWTRPLVLVILALRLDLVLDTSYVYSHFGNSRGIHPHSSESNGVSQGYSPASFGATTWQNSNGRVKPFARKYMLASGSQFFPFAS